MGSGGRLIAAASAAQAQEHEREREREQREGGEYAARDNDNNEPALGGATFASPAGRIAASIGSRLRFGLLGSGAGGKRLASARDANNNRTAGRRRRQQDTSGERSSSCWRADLCGSSAGGQAKRPASQWQAGRHCAIVAAAAAGGELRNTYASGRAAAAADDDNNSASARAANNDGAANSKIWPNSGGGGQYLPSCCCSSFNLNDHTPPPADGNNNSLACKSAHDERLARRREDADDACDDARINLARISGRGLGERRRPEGGLEAGGQRESERRARQLNWAGASARWPAGSAQAPPTPPTSLARSLASAWSRFKISSSSGRRQRNASRASRESSLECKVNGESGAPDSLAREANNNDERPLKQSVLEIKRRELEVLRLELNGFELQQREPARQQFGAQAIASLVRGRRRAFLNLAKQGDNIVLLADERARQCDREPAQATVLAEASVNRRRSHLSEIRASGESGCGQRVPLKLKQFNYVERLRRRRGARDSNCLLEEDEREDEDCEEEAEDLEGPKMLPVDLKKSAREKNSALRMPLRNFVKRPPNVTSELLLLATTALWLLLMLLLAGAAQLALAQHQHQHPHQHQHQHQPPPFARSQQQQQQQQAPLARNGAAQQTGAGNAGAANLAPASAPPAASSSGSLVANINCNKIRGHVTLTPTLEGGATVTTQITAGPPGEVYQWSIHQFPIKPGAAMCSCSSLILGSKLIDLSDLHGNLPSDQEFSVQSSLQLFGSDSPVGHSLLLRGLKTGMVACGTFLPTNRKSNYRAKFHTPLSGSITIFQTSFGTSFLSHLMYSNGTRRHSMHRFDLVRSDDDIITTSLLGANGGGSGASANGGFSPTAARNLDQLEQREHENELQACRRFSSGEPLFRNLTYQLAVSTENFGMRGRTALVLPQIAFETFSSVYVVVYSEHDPMEPIACAPLRFVKPKTAAAKFQAVSVQGNIVFSQDSPYDVTVARVNLNFPNSDGHSYGIDELPMIIRRKSDTRVCPNIREIIYNPHHIEPSSVPPEGEATSDQYAVGDLSGKYGSLTGKSSEKITANDHNLPLFGPVSIIGRALTIYSADGVAIACSNVELTTPMTTAFATFDFGIQGQFIFRQPMNDCNGDTYVYIEVSKPTERATSQQQQQQDKQAPVASLASNNNNNNQHDGHSRSLDHNWHIHVNPVDSGLEHLSTTECSLAGNHFNPYNTSTQTIYSRDCTPFNVLRCELGDLSSKMFTIEIPPYKVKSGGQEPDIGKFFGTDIDLPLCGPVSIVNRSVVVHVADFGLQRLACSTVIEFKPRS